MEYGRYVAWVQLVVRLRATRAGFNTVHPQHGTAMRYFRLSLIVVGALLIALAVLTDLLPGSRPGFGAKQLSLTLLGMLLLGWGLFLARSAWQKQALAAGMLVISIFIAEILLRWTYAPHLAAILQLDDSCLFRPIPGASRVWRSPLDVSDQVFVEINEDGFRGSPLRPPGSATRIAVYGDSYIMAEFTPRAQTFVKRLETKLTDRLKTPVETINAGVTSYGPGQICVRLPDDLELLRPNLLVVCIFAGNDFGDLMRNRLYRFDDGVLVRNEIQIGPRMRGTFAHANSSLMLYKLASRWLRRFDQAGMDVPHPDDPLKQRQERFANWLDVCVKEYEQFVVERDNLVEEWRSDRYDADVSATPRSDSARHKKKLMQGVLGRLQKIATEAEIPLLVVIIPSSVDVADQHDIIAVDTDIYPDYRRSALTDAVANSAQKLGISHFDLFDTLDGPDAKSYYRDFDDHWSAAGQERCAEAVASFIASRGLASKDRDAHNQDQR